MANDKGRAAEEAGLHQLILEMRQELADLRARLDEATAAKAPLEPPTLISEEWKAWAALSAQEKTQLIADQTYGPAPGLKPFDVQLVYRPRRDQGGNVTPPTSEHPRVRLHARGDAEAGALYQHLCGITGFNTDESELKVELAAAA